MILHGFDIDFTLLDSSHRAHLLKVYCTVCGSQKDLEAKGHSLCPTCSWETPGECPPESWEAFNDPVLMARDTPDPKAVSYVKRVRSMGHLVYYNTGRSEISREITELWLQEHVGKLPEETLLMRPNNKLHTPSVEVKEANFLKTFGPGSGFPPSDFFFYDDDESVKSMYRQYGIMLQSPFVFEHIHA